MIRSFVVAGGCLFLAACGASGGGGTVVTPTPTPVSTPSPTPTPTPTPTVSYTKFVDLTGDQLHNGTCTGIYMMGVGYTPGLQGSTPFSPGVVAYAAATQTYTQGANGYRQSFGPAERDVIVPDGTVAAYTKVVDPTQTDLFSLSLLRSRGTALEYVRLVEAKLRNSNYSCVIGVPTALIDIPAGASVPFDEVVLAGTAYDSSSGVTVAYDLAKSTASFRADLTTGQVYPILHLIGSAPGLPDKDFGVLNGDGSVGIYDGAISSVGYTGAFNSEPFARFTGAFFGPQGREFAMLVTVLRYDGGRNAFTVNARVYGRR